MSGGFFDCQQYSLHDMADSIERLIQSNDDQSLNEWGDKNGRNFSSETIEELKNAVYLLNAAAIYAQRIDWLVSGDDSEDSFHSRLLEDLKEIK